MWRAKMAWSSSQTTRTSPLGPTATVAPRALLETAMRSATLKDVVPARRRYTVRVCEASPVTTARSPRALPARPITRWPVLALRPCAAPRAPPAVPRATVEWLRSVTVPLTSVEPAMAMWLPAYAVRRPAAMATGCAGPGWPLGPRPTSSLGGPPGEPAAVRLIGASRTAVPAGVTTIGVDDPRAPGMVAGADHGGAARAVAGAARAAAVRSTTRRRDMSPKRRAKLAGFIAIALSWARTSWPRARSPGPPWRGRRRGRARRRRAPARCPACRP